MYIRNLSLQAREKELRSGGGADGVLHMSL